jgi:porin
VTGNLFGGQRSGKSGGKTFLLLASLCAAVPAHADDLLSGLAPDGITPSVSYTGNEAVNLAGGDKRGATYGGNLQLQVKIDGEAVAAMPGLSGFLDLMLINGDQPSKYVGDAQMVSNIAAPSALRLYEAWLQYNIPGTGFSILTGRYDLNTEFHRLDSANLFLNSSFATGAAFNASGFAGPSTFPDPSLGVRLGYKPNTNTIFRVAIMDGAPPDQIDGSPPPFAERSGALIVTETAFLTRGNPIEPISDPRSRFGRFSGLPPYDDKIAVGAWYYTGGFNDLSEIAPNGAPKRRQGEAGAYLLLDRLLTTIGQRRITGFIEPGVADPAVDRFGMYFGSGLTVTGLFPRRPDDQAGIAAAVARNGSHYIAGQQQDGVPVSGAETAIELTYLAQVASALAVQPDVQYVIHPNTDPRVANATVIQLRFAITF